VDEINGPRIDLAEVNANINTIRVSAPAWDMATTQVISMANNFEDLKNR